MCDFIEEAYDIEYIYHYIPRPLIKMNWIKGSKNIVRALHHEVNYDHRLYHRCSQQHWLYSHPRKTWSSIPRYDSDLRMKEQKDALVTEKINVQ